MPSDVCAHIVIATLESIRVSSSTAIAYGSESPPAPPYSSGNGIPIQPELAHLRHELVGERLRAVQLLGDRLDLLKREVADRPLQQLRVVVEFEVHRRAMLRASSTSSRTPNPLPPLAA